MKPSVGLFVTCLIDTFRPSVGFAAAKLIEASGCTVDVPAGQTCCGQPAYNSGDTASARSIAQQTIRAFTGFDYVVVPSGSCAAMLKIHYPKLFGRDDADKHASAIAFAERVYELTSFLSNIRGMTKVPGTCHGRVTYHDACSGLRELGIKSAPRKLLSAMPGVELVESTNCEACCGFGGLFAEKYPGISNAITTKKVDDLYDSRAPLALSGDLGCLMNIAGKCARDRRGLACRHIAEVLAGELSDPPIAGR